MRNANPKLTKRLVRESSVRRANRKLTDVSAMSRDTADGYAPAMDAARAHATASGIRRVGYALLFSGFIRISPASWLSVVQHVAVVAALGVLAWTARGVAGRWLASAAVAYGVSGAALHLSGNGARGTVIAAGAGSLVLLVCGLSALGNLPGDVRLRRRWARVRIEAVVAAIGLAMLAGAVASGGVRSGYGVSNSYFEVDIVDGPWVLWFLAAACVLMCIEAVIAGWRTADWLEAAVAAAPAPVEQADTIRS